MRSKSVNFVQIALLGVYFLCLTIPWVYYRFGSKTGALFFLLWLVIVHAQKGRKRPNWFEVAFVWLFVLHFFLPYAYWLFGYGERIGFGNIANWANMLAMFLIFSYYERSQNYRELKMIVLGVLALYFLSATMNASMLANNVNASRDMTSGDAVVEGLIAGVARMDFVIAFALLAPVLFYVAVRSSKKLKIPLFLLSGVLALATLRATYAIVTMGMALGFVFACIALLRYVRKLVSVVFVAVVVLLFWFPVILSPFVNVLLSLTDKAYGNDQYVLKLKEVTQVVEAGMFSEQGPLGYRMYLYKASWESFFDSPLIGCGRYTIAGSGRSPSGGHTEIPDRLAEMGLLWLAIVLPMFFCFYKAITKVPCKLLRTERSKLFGIFMWPSLWICFLDPCHSPMVWGVFFFMIPSLPLLMPKVEKEIQMSGRPCLGLRKWQAW